MRFVVITGLSGSGKSSAVRNLEDLGYYCIDNMPPILMPKFAELCFGAGGQFNKVAVVSDIRGGDMFSQLFASLEELKTSGYQYEILFLNASDEVLIQRYKETRRKHPLDNGERLPEAIAHERLLLQQIKEHADHLIDTSNKSQRQLRAEIEQIFKGNETGYTLAVNVMSFGFKYGLPLDADLVFDVRFLPNPYYIRELKNHTGLDSCVSDYVMGFEESKVFLAKMLDMLEFLLPRYTAEGKSQLVIAIGCTGGKHRSVTLAEQVYHDLKERYNVIVTHRDEGK